MIRQKALPSLQIKSVIFISPSTIIFWGDGPKTVVKAQDEPFDKEKGLSMAIVKKVYGNTGSYFDVIKKWVNHGKVLDNPMPKSVPISKKIINGVGELAETIKEMKANNDRAEGSSNRGNQKTEER